MTPPRPRFRATWYCTDALDADWPLGATGWRVTVEGDAPLKVDVAFPIEPRPRRVAATTPGSTAVSRGQLGGGGLRSATRAR